MFFGIKDGDFVIPHFSRLIVKGLTIHSIIGRQIFKSWQIAQRILSDRTNGIQDAMWQVIMNEGKGTVIPFSEYSIALLEERMAEYPKLIFDMQS